MHYNSKVYQKFPSLDRRKSAAEVGEELHDHQVAEAAFVQFQIYNTKGQQFDISQIRDESEELGDGQSKLVHILGINRALKHSKEKLKERDLLCPVPALASDT